MILMGKEDMAKSFFFYALYNHLKKNNNCYFESIKRKSDLSFCEDLNGDIIFLDSYNSIYGSKNGEILLFKLFNESKQKNAKCNECGMQYLCKINEETKRRISFFNINCVLWDIV